MERPIIKHLLAIVRIALGAIFIYAGIIKIVDTASFAGSIAAYRIMPYFFNYLVAAVLPWLELFCGALLVTGLRVKPAAAIIALLNLVFIAALVSAMARGLEIDCGCFKQGTKEPPLQAILRDIVFLLMAMFVFWKGERRLNA